MNTDFIARKTRTVSQNPFITTIFTADPSAHVWEADGRMYIYASRDMDPARGCDLMDHYHVFSSEDMVNWRDEGEILSSDDVSWGRPEGGFMWAPDCAYRDGHYYYYFPHPSGSRWNDTWKIGVAVSDRPDSGFVDRGYIEGLGGDSMIDPCVFADEDGRVYMYYGGGAMPRGGEMNPDMVSMKEEMRPMEGLVDFHEASWVFKRNGIYYMTYSDNCPGANHLCYAMSANPLGPWDYKGFYLEPTGCDTSHGSIVEFKGTWYALYHNCDLSHQGNLRSICCDPLEFNEDGTIRTVVQSKNGRPPAGPAPVTDSRMKIYGAADAIVGGAAEKYAEGNAYQSTAIHHFREEQSFAEFRKVDGYDGQRVTLGFYYACSDRLSKLRLIINDADYSLINFLQTGFSYYFAGYASFTVRLLPGQENTIRLLGGHGDLSLEALSVEPLE